MFRIIFYTFYLLTGLYLFNCSLTEPQQRERNSYVLRLINDFPGPKELMLSEYELKFAQKQNITIKEFLIWNVDKIDKKFMKLRCEYTELSLYIVYALKFDVIDKNVMDTQLLETFKEILSRILSIYYYTLGSITKGTWFTSIIVNALIDGKATPDELYFGFIEEMFSFCHQCYNGGNLPDSPKNYVPDLQTILKIAFRLKIFDNSRPQTFNEIYKYEDVTNIYSFIWDNPQGYQMFVPGAIFPNYNTHYIREAYNKVLYSWKLDYRVLTQYTDVIKKNLILVTYYYLSLHCSYLVSCVSNEIITDDFNAFLKLFQTPLDTFYLIVEFSQYVHSDPFRGLLDCMRQGTIRNRQGLINYSNKIISAFNNEARIFNIRGLQLIKYLENGSNKITFDYCDAQNQLNLYAYDLNEYFLGVKLGMAPIDFTILRTFTLCCLTDLSY